jgi:hypothetical protein
LTTKKKRAIANVQVRSPKEVSNDDVKNKDDVVLESDIDELKQRQVSQQK